jgi:hypothetical protein
MNGHSSLLLGSVSVSSTQKTSQKAVLVIRTIPTVALAVGVRPSALPFVGEEMSDLTFRRN